MANLNEIYDHDEHLRMVTLLKEFKKHALKKDQELVDANLIEPSLVSEDHWSEQSLEQQEFASVPLGIFDNDSESNWSEQSLEQQEFSAQPLGAFDNASESDWLEHSLEQQEFSAIFGDDKESWLSDDWS